MVGSLNGSTITGFVRFQQSSIDDPIIISVNITGLPAGQGTFRRGFHIHSTNFQSTSDNTTVRCGSIGPHFNPTNQSHGDISSTVRHVGDYGNVISDNNGNIITTFNDTVSDLFGPFGILGRTVVLHQLEDDLGPGVTNGILILYFLNLNLIFEIIE